MMDPLYLLPVVVLGTVLWLFGGCSEDESSGDAGDKGDLDTNGPDSDADGDGDATLSDEYPGDVGMASDEAVVWIEDFEADSVSAVVARYDDYKNTAGMSLVTDVPEESSGNRALGLSAGTASEVATDFYKSFGGGYDEWYLRWYVKYEPDGVYHHSGVWFGGYNPPSSWPDPRAGTKPSGDDRFSIALESGADASGGIGRLDFYNYWMQMHGWSSNPSDPYYGNALAQYSSTSFDDQWRCVEVHFKVNTDMSSSEGAVLELWINDERIVRFTQTEGLGFWVGDHFCTEDADMSTCTDYQGGQEMIPLDLQVRTVPELQLNHFWPQNFTDAAADTTVWFDDMVIATRRIGCIRY